MATRKLSAASLLLISALVPAAGFAAPSVVRGPDAQERLAVIRSVVILPVNCPGTLDCAVSERELAGYLRSEQRIKVVESRFLAQLLYERGLEVGAVLDAVQGPALLAELGVVAVVAPKVLEFQRLESYLGQRQPGFELRAELEFIVPGAAPLAKGSDTDGGPDMQLAGKTPLGRIYLRVAKAIFGNQKRR